MERLKRPPFYKLFAFKVLLFNALIFLSIAAPLWTISKGNYKNIMDRSSIQRVVFFNLYHSLSYKTIAELDSVIDSRSGILPRERYFIFNENMELLFDSGIRREFEFDLSYRLILPSPYRSVKEDIGEKPQDLLRSMELLYKNEHRDYNLPQKAIINVKGDDGLDRVILRCRKIYIEESGYCYLVLSSSVVDILMQNRAVKERFLFIYLTVILLAIVLTFLLSRSVTKPFNKLYRYSFDLMSNKNPEGDLKTNSVSGEIDYICSALHLLFKGQKKMADNFKQFSSDVVHELKTPLSAIRSGIDLYSEIEDTEERSLIHRRILKRIQHMESLMNEIQHIGNLESIIYKNEYSSYNEVLNVLNDIENVYASKQIAVNIGDDLNRIKIPLKPDKLWQVLDNLISNAVSFSPEVGSVSLNIYSENNFFYIKVIDCGPGITVAEKEKLTDYFYTYRPNDTESKHSGLGLAIVKAILGSCTGELSYLNIPQGGAEFCCKMPVYYS